MEQFLMQRDLFGRPIAVQVTHLDSGLHVLLVGGDSTHVGSVSMADGGKLLCSYAFPTHREQVISDKWAICISAECQCAVTVACGIHYNNAAKHQIVTILRLTDDLLQELLKKLERTGE